MRKIFLNLDFSSLQLKKLLYNFLCLLFICISGTCYGQSKISNILYSLSLEKTVFNDIYDNLGDDKIVLQFVLDKSDPSLLTLAAWPSKDHDYNDNDPQAILVIGTASSFHATKNVFLGDQQIKKNVIRKIYKLFNPSPKPGDPPPPVYKFLILDPQIDANNHIYYEVSVSDISLTKVPIGKTDPSPPAHSN